MVIATAEGAVEVVAVGNVAAEDVAEEVAVEEDTVEVGGGTVLSVTVVTDEVTGLSFGLSWLLAVTVTLAEAGGVASSSEGIL